jgi:hypothetical protein
MGRPTKCTPDVTRRLVEAFRVGATHAIACEYAGIVKETMYQWFEKAAQGREPYVTCAAQVKRSQGVAAVGWLAKIEQAASAGDWRAAAWKLERRYPEEYGRQVQDVQHRFDGPLQIALVQYGHEPDAVS